MCDGRHHRPDGLAATARLITAAALIMVAVFSAFVLGDDRSLKLFGLVLGDDRSLKLFGLGLAVAVFVDATVVRMLLVPATMELLGDRNWWLPKWLGRMLPRVHVEGHAWAIEQLDRHDHELVAAGRD